MLKLEFIHFCTVNQFEQLQFEMYSSFLTLLGGFLAYALIVIFVMTFMTQIAYRYLNQAKCVNISTFYLYNFDFNYDVNKDDQ